MQKLRNTKNGGKEKDIKLHRIYQIQQICVCFGDNDANRVGFPWQPEAIYNPLDVNELFMAIVTFEVFHFSKLG